MGSHTDNHSHHHHTRKSCLFLGFPFDLYVNQDQCLNATVEFACKAKFYTLLSLTFIISQTNFRPFLSILLFSTAPKLTTMRTASAHDMNALHYEPDVDFDADAKMTTPMTHAHTGERAHGHDDVCWVFLFLFFCARFLWLDSQMARNFVSQSDIFMFDLLFIWLLYSRRRCKGRLPALYGASLHSHLLRTRRLSSARYLLCLGDCVITYLWRRVNALSENNLAPWQPRTFSKLFTLSSCYFLPVGHSFIVDKEGAMMGRKATNTIPLLMKVCCCSFFLLLLCDSYLIAIQPHTRYIMFFTFIISIFLVLDWDGERRGARNERRHGHQLGTQIGRASCRERVFLTV